MEAARGLLGQGHAHSQAQAPLTVEQQVEGAIRTGLRPPSREPAWQWCENNIVLPPSEGLFTGPYRTDLTPMIRSVFERAQNPRTRRLVLLVSAQSSKTLFALCFLAWSVVEDPATTMWIMASKDNCEEFLRKRMEPFFVSSPTLHALWPPRREHRTLRLIQFNSMNLVQRGSNSRIGLQSDPVRRIICDERREWKAGAIDLVRERLKTFHNAIEISMGTAGEENDQLHRDWLEGSQTIFVWSCVQCGHKQPFRWSTKATPIFPEIKRGGVVWETSEVTKPGGRWNYDAVRRTVGCECEACGFLYRDGQKHALLKTLTEQHGNPEALPEKPSYHWNELYMQWTNSAWPELVVKFLKAKAASKRGELEPLKSVVTETFGEPWRPPSDAVEHAQILERRGRYKMGDLWPAEQKEKTLHVLSIDVQQGYLKCVLRAYRKGPRSRLVWAGEVHTYADAYDLCVKYDVKPGAVFVDCSFERGTVERECLRYGWNPIEGDERALFALPEPVMDPTTRKLVRVKAPWTYKRIDPYRGTGQEGRQHIRSFVWSNPTYMERFYFYVLKGLAAEWEIPLDIDQAVPTYIPEVMAYERVADTDEAGAVAYRWLFRGRRHDYADCELMQLAAADICNISRTEIVSREGGEGEESVKGH